MLKWSIENQNGREPLWIQIIPLGQSVVTYLAPKMHSSFVINALGLNRPWASSLIYITYTPTITFQILVGYVKPSLF